MSAMGKRDAFLVTFGMTTLGVVVGGLVIDKTVHRRSKDLDEIVATAIVSGLVSGTTAALLTAGPTPLSATGAGRLRAENLIALLNGEKL